MNYLTTIFVIVVVLIAINLFKYDSFVINNKTYVVTRSPHSFETARILHRIDTNLANIARKVGYEYHDVHLSDHTPTPAVNFVAYSQNKRNIRLCTHYNNEPTDFGSLMYIAIHELAHCIVPHYDPLDAYGRTKHSDEFLETVTRLYDVARANNIAVNHNIQGTLFCGHTL